MCQITHLEAYNYVDEPGHEKHWIVQIEPRQLDATAKEEIDRQSIFLNITTLVNVYQGQLIRDIV